MFNGGCYSKIPATPLPRPAQPSFWSVCFDLGVWYED